MSASSRSTCFLTLASKFRLVFDAIAPDDSFFHALAQEAIHRFAIGHRVAGKFIAKIVELKG